MCAVVHVCRGGACVPVWCMCQSRSQTLQKQLQDMHEQLEQTAVEMKTFDNLREHELIAVPKRVEVRTGIHSRSSAGWLCEVCENSATVTTTL